MGYWDARSPNVEGRKQRLCDQAIEGNGLVAYLEDEPVGWCSLEPRINYPYLRQTVWKGRNQDRDDPMIWAITCFVTRAGFRHQGVSVALTAATVDFARGRGASALEAYPMRPAPGTEVTWGEMHVGHVNGFLAAGFRIVHEPSLRRVIVRYEF